MDNTPDAGLYSDLGFYEQSPLDPSLSDLINLNAGGPTVGPPGPDSGYGSPLSKVLALPQLLLQLTSDVGTAVDDVEKINPIGWLTPVMKVAGHVNALLVDAATAVVDMMTAENAGGMSGVGGQAHDLWQFIANWSGGTLYRGLLVAGLGVDVNEFDDDANRGVNVIDTMLSFAFIMQFVGGALEATGKGLFGGRWGEALSKAIMEIPEELGITWAMGMSIDEAFKTAVGRSVEEGINRQKRGNRIEWPQLRTMLKQHAFEGLSTGGTGKVEGSVSGVPDTPGLAVFKDLLANQGYPDWQIDLIAKLNDMQIPVADIAQLWYRDIIDDSKAHELIGQLGFSPEQTGWIYDLYVAKSENTASVTYRSIARQMLVNHLITKDQYTTILKKANYPSRLIDQDLAAIDLEQSVGKVLQSVTTIKTLYQRGTHDADVARKQLRELNYSDDYITELINSWNLPPLRRTHGLSQAKILAYWVAGVIKNRDSAYTQLLATGLTTDAANFLLDNPASAHVTTHALTPGLITQAYIDGAINEVDLSSAYTRVGVTADALPKYVSVAKYRLSQRKGSPHPTQFPDTALYREAQKEGIIDFTTAVSMYEHLGWSPDAALLIAEIVNKGPYQKPVASPFATLADAETYMTTHGYNVIAPPDPMLMAAEAMLASNGYSWVLWSEGSGTGTLPPPPILPP